MIGHSCNLIPVIISEAGHLPWLSARCFLLLRVLCVASEGPVPSLLCRGSLLIREVSPGSCGSQQASAGCPPRAGAAATRGTRAFSCGREPTPPVSSARWCGSCRWPLLRKSPLVHADKAMFTCSTVTGAEAVARGRCGGCRMGCGGTAGRRKEAGESCSLGSHRGKCSSVCRNLSPWFIWIK